jgi:APA family basic amino acid/polyamine antiporter
VPILGMASNLLMMFYLGWENWLRLFVWLVIGLAIYFTYSRYHSRLANPVPAREPVRRTRRR